MKILIITMNTNGGMVHYTSQLANSLSKKDDVVVIGPEGLDNDNFLKSVKIIELKVGNIIKNFFINTLNFFRPIKFLRTIYKENPDIIHFNECHLWTSLFMPFLRRKFKIITMIHDVTPHYGSRKWDQIFSKKLHIWFSDGLLVHGNYSKNKLNINNRCWSIPHGDYSFFLKYIENEIEEEKNTILFFGRIADYKGLDNLIDAINYIYLNYSLHIKLIIAGAGNINKYRNSLNYDCFEIHNRFIENHEVNHFFQRASAVILPYKEASQTGIIPIAYAFKKPVIVTNVGSIPEVVENGKTGFIVTPNNYKELVDAINRILNDDELKIQMGERAYKKMKNELSWNKISNDLIKIYNEVLVKE